MKKNWMSWSDFPVWMKALIVMYWFVMGSVVLLAAAAWATFWSNGYFP